MENLPARESVHREMEDLERATTHQIATADKQLTGSQLEYHGTGYKTDLLVNLSECSDKEIVKEGCSEWCQDSDNDQDETHVSLHCTATPHPMVVETTINQRSPVSVSESLGAVEEPGASPASAPADINHEEDKCLNDEDESSDWDVESFDEDDTNEFAQHPIDHRHPVLMEPEQHTTRIDDESGDDLEEIEEEDEQVEEEDEAIEEEENNGILHVYEFPQRRFQTPEQFDAYIWHTVFKIKEAKEQIKLLNQKNYYDHERLDTATERGRTDYALQLSIAIATREQVKSMFQTYVNARVRELRTAGARLDNDGFDD